MLRTHRGYGLALIHSSGRRLGELLLLFHLLLPRDAKDFLLERLAFPRRHGRLVPRGEAIPLSELIEPLLLVVGHHSLSMVGSSNPNLRHVAVADLQTPKAELLFDGEEVVDRLLSAAIHAQNDASVLHQHAEVGPFVPGRRAAVENGFAGLRVENTRSDERREVLH